ncbi:MAG: flagellar filament capping protein FliD [Gammaproteobacteria bacterium]|nr:flagellar filament capping protein FliD [Gammaproteobacteria bacterium]MBU1731951.1 flagellar filament capping protein FliD [Gammaproteobacteria bacterium]MBU1893089.1 flagellar filament capping protein FliD [Gammaproteobacteria bacterium]
MAISSPGIGSNLDINGIVSQLMQLEQRPLTLLAQKEAGFQGKISAFGSLNGAISALQSTATSLVPSTGVTAAEKFTTYKAAVTDTTIATASASSSAVSGTYSLEVISLAKTQRLTSGANPSVGSGVRTMTIETGSVAGGVGSGGAFTASGTVAISLDSSVTTLAGVRDAINAANAGVTATVITSGADSYLSLSSNESGTASVMRVTGDVLALNYDPSTNTGGLIQNTGDEAVDSALKINGISITGSGNVVSEAVDGLTITLKAIGTTTVTVTRDTSSLSAGVSAFVKAYNDFNTTAVSLGRYDAATKQGGPLIGDSTLRSAENTFRSLIGNTPSGLSDSSLQRLSDIGVTMQKDGSLAVDSTKLNAAIADDFNSVANLVSAYGSAFKTAADVMVGTDGLITSRTEGLNASIKSLGKQSDSIQQRLVQIEARYRKQFTTLDTLIANMTQTSNFLTQQLANLPGASS